MELPKYTGTGVGQSRLPAGVRVMDDLSDWRVVDFGVEGGRGLVMTTLKVGIADYGEMRARTLRIARGEEHPGPDDPKIWFTSTESFAKVLSASNRKLLRTIAKRSPSSLEELADMTGRAKSNPSRTLTNMVEYGLVTLELPLTDHEAQRKAAGDGS